MVSDLDVLILIPAFPHMSTSVHAEGYGLMKLTQLHELYTQTHIWFSATNSTIMRFQGQNLIFQSLFQTEYFFGWWGYLYEQFKAFSISDESSVDFREKRPPPKAAWYGNSIDVASYH